MRSYGYSLRTLLLSLSNTTTTKTSLSPHLLHQRCYYPIRRFSSFSASFEHGLCYADSPKKYLYVGFESKSSCMLSRVSLGPSATTPWEYLWLMLRACNVGFIGLGNMGSRMANNLMKAGYKVIVHDINHDVMKMFTDMGASPKATPLEVAEASEVVITMLPSPSHVLNVYSGPDGLLGGGNLVRSHLFIDSSTVDPQTSRKLSAMVSNCTSRGNKGDERTSVMLDAPVSGGVLAAEAGSLTFMVGGPEDAYLKAKPLLLSMGKSTVYCGGAGNGSAAKICNNLAMAVSMLGVSEALALGQSLGISASTLTRVFNSSSARCWSSDTYNPVPGVMDGVPSSRNYEGGFASKLMAKDLNLAVASAQEITQKIPVAFQAKEIYKELCDGGHENEDFSSIFRHYYLGKDEYGSS